LNYKPSIAQKTTANILNCFFLDMFKRVPMAVWRPKGRLFSTSRVICNNDYNFDFSQLKQFRAPLRTTEIGVDALHDPLFNKGTAFKDGERDRIRIRGLIPPRRLSMQSQIARVLTWIRNEESPIKKNIMLEDLHDRNETLYHRILVDYIEEMAPIIYTPTVGQACKEFGQRYRRPRGMYFSAEDRGHMAAMVYNWPHRDVHVIVVTDGSRILGLGDLGANGMGIPIGKLSLYCAAGGIAPHRVLPVTLDVGTNNEELLSNPYYLGLQQPRLTGMEYFSVVDEFMQAVKHRWPNALVQFEDFQSEVAQPLLNNYRQSHLCFNDDIQGTGATVLAGCLSALRAKGAEVTSLGDEKIVIAGAGSAGIGVATVLLQAMLEQGRDEEEALKSFFISDQFGLLTKDRDDLNAEQFLFAKDKGTEQMSLLDIIKQEVSVFEKSRLLKWSEQWRACYLLLLSARFLSLFVFGLGKITKSSYKLPIAAANFLFFFPLSISCHSPWKETDYFDGCDDGRRTVQR